MKEKPESGWISLWDQGWEVSTTDKELGGQKVGFGNRLVSSFERSFSMELSDG
jgi:hypothetical protein